MKKTKILVLGMSSNTGGIETFIYNMVLKADKEHFIFDFVFSGDAKMAFEDELIKMNSSIYKICPRKQNRKKHIQDLTEILSKGYDIMHIHLMTYSWYEPIVIANKKGVKIIFHSHSTGVPENEYLVRIRDKIGRFMTRNIDFYRIACGTAAGKYMFGNKKFEVVHNGIDFNKFSFNSNSRNKIRKQYEIDDNTILLGCVAVFLPFKNHEFLIDVFNSFHKKKPNSKLMLMGDGFTRRGIEEKVKNLNLSNDVIFTGIRRDVNEFYSAFDIFINTAKKEGFCISIVEAQVNGLKCYVSDGNDEEIDISSNVKIIPLKKTPDEWSEIIVKGDNSRTMNADKFISDSYNSNSSYNRMFEIYDKLS